MKTLSQQLPTKLCERKCFVSSSYGHTSTCQDRECSLSPRSSAQGAQYPPCRLGVFTVLKIFKKNVFVAFRGLFSNRSRAPRYSGHAGMRTSCTVHALQQCRCWMRARRPQNRHARTQHRAHTPFWSKIAELPPQLSLKSRSR